MAASIRRHPPVSTRPERFRRWHKAVYTHYPHWAFLGLAMPTWVLIWFVILAALSLVANWSRVS